MHQNEKKIEYQTIAMMALNGLYDRYLKADNKDNLCTDLGLLIDFTSKHDCLDGLVADAVYKVIAREELLSWLQEKLTNE